MTNNKKTLKRYPLKVEGEDLVRKTPLPDELPFFQRRWVRNTLWAIFIVLVYLALRHFQQGEVIKTQVPPVQLKTLTGQVIDLSKPQPKPYLIHFWGTWCPICNYQHDDIRKLSEKYPVIAIAVQSTSDEELRHFSDKNFIPKKLIVNDFDETLMKQFKVTAVPTDLYVMPDGRIKFVEVGFTSYLGFWLRLWWMEHFG